MSQEGGSPSAKGQPRDGLKVATEDSSRGGTLRPQRIFQRPLRQHFAPALTEHLFQNNLEQHQKNKQTKLI